ncbi:MAG TPA: SdrD B-like domain-containing protein [Gemmataceae bacterium]|nr:SdrD B-like domain-containing protein [Gemmataceae bacterium]
MNPFLRLFGSRPAAHRSERRPPLSLEPLEDRCVPSTSGLSAITGNFNGTAISAGDSLWLSSVLKVNGLGSSPVTLNFSNDVITFTAGGSNYSVDAPNAAVIFSPTATAAVTTFDALTNTWTTTLPTHFSGNGFLDGVALPLPNGLPGGIKNVTWQGQFTSSATGISVNWQWAAAAYTQFGSDYNALNVKPIDDNHYSQNSDHAGAPESYLSFVVGGGTGGGGSNFTGSYSATASVNPPAVATLSGFVFNENTGGGFAGLTVTLTYANGQTLTTTTAADGSYSFTGLQPGTYTVSIIPPKMYTSSDQVGTVNGATDGTSISGSILGSINLAGGNAGVNYDFYEMYAGS